MKYSVLILRQKGVKILPIFVNLFQMVFHLKQWGEKKKKGISFIWILDWKLQLLNLVYLFSLFQCNSWSSYRMCVSRHDFYSLSLRVCVKINTFFFNCPNLKKRSVLFCGCPVLTSTYYVCFFCKFYIYLQNIKTQKLLRAEV